MFELTCGAALCMTLALVIQLSTTIETQGVGSSTPTPNKSYLDPMILEDSTLPCGSWCFLAVEIKRPFTAKKS